ncbi:hypothetical protein VaNZ11_008998 [Volvox africanus]|uniref:Uncharacterized protein n=1 Tax=Volvox africanus TaxID=51714 RepID=A0ABQ5S6A4_9CHLO|nr:hypothetical protein VaNZ11_008998 [Volvox africanus]
MSDIFNNCTCKDQHGMAKLRQERGTSYLVLSVALCLVYHADTYTHLARVLNHAVCVVEPDIFHAHLAKGLRSQFPDYPCTAQPPDSPTRQQLLYLLVRSYASHAAYLKPPVLSPSEAWCFVSVILTWLFTFAILLPPLRRRLSARIQLVWLAANLANDLFTPPLCWALLHTAPPSFIRHYTPVMCEALGYTVLFGLPPWFVYSIAAIVTTSLSIITTLLLRHGLVDKVPFNLPSLWVRQIITLAAVLAFTALREQIWRRLLCPVTSAGWFKWSPLSGAPQTLIEGSQGKALVMPPCPPPPAMLRPRTVPRSWWASWSWAPWTTSSLRAATVSLSSSKQGSSGNLPSLSPAASLQRQLDSEPPAKFSPSPTAREDVGAEARGAARPLRRRGPSSKLQQLLCRQENERLDEQGLIAQLVARGGGGSGGGSSGGGDDSGGRKDGNSNDDVSAWWPMLKSYNRAWLAGGECGMDGPGCRTGDGDEGSSSSGGGRGGGSGGGSGGVKSWGGQQLLSEPAGSGAQGWGCCGGKRQLRQLPPALLQPPLELQPRLQLHPRLPPEEACRMKTTGLQPHPLVPPQCLLPSIEAPVRPACAGPQQYRLDPVQQPQPDQHPSGLLRLSVDAFARSEPAISAAAAAAAVATAVGGAVTAAASEEANRDGTAGEHLRVRLTTLATSADQLARPPPPPSGAAANSIGPDAWSPPMQYRPSLVRPGNTIFPDPPASVQSLLPPPPPPLSPPPSPSAAKSKPPPITIDRLQAMVAAARSAPYCPDPWVRMTRVHLRIPDMAAAELPAGWLQDMLMKLSRTLQPDCTLVSITAFDGSSSGSGPQPSAASAAATAGVSAAEVMDAAQFNNN